MGSKANSDVALGDVRSTSYNAATANSVGYQGTIEDALAQIRAEPDEVRGYWPFNRSRERHELLRFLGVFKDREQMSGLQRLSDEVRYPLFMYPEDDTVEYGAPEQRDPNFYTLAYAMKNWPESFGDPNREPRL